MQYDAIIVGGGPSGSFTAANIAKNGFSVLMIEEHKKIGEPVQCAGLVSPRTLALASAPENIVLKSYWGARILSPLGAELPVSGDRIYAQAVDRAAFDRHVAGLAEQPGADIITGARAAGITRVRDGFRVNINTDRKIEAIKCRLLIGADGVNSRVARWLGLPPAGSKVAMYAGELELQTGNQEEVSILLGQTFAPGWFGWVIPLASSQARVGVGSFYGGRSPRYYLKKMTESFPGIFRNFRELRYTGGTVPFGPMKKIFSSHAMLVGDAAAQVKPMSGGGLYTGMRGAQICALVASQALTNDRLEERHLADYQKLWDSEFKVEFQSSVWYREVYDGMNDREADSLLRFLSRPYWRKLIARHGDIDYPSWLAGRLYGAGPWLQKFARAAVGMVGGGENYIKTSSGERF